MVRFPEISSSLDQEELRSEFFRSFLLVVLFSSILVIAVLNYLFIEGQLTSYYGGLPTFLMLIAFIAVFIFYQLATLGFLKKQIRLSLPVTVSYKIVHTMIELSFPSIIMLLLLTKLGMVSIVDSPIMLTYFLMIILSVLHLDYRVNIFAGIFAGVLYAGVIYYAFTYVGIRHNRDLLMPANYYYIRSLILALSGGAAAFVSAELKNRIKSAFESRNEKNKVEMLFGQQVSREVSKALMDEKGGTKRLEATVMFLDIRNFTAFADTHTAEEVIDYQNKFLSPIIDIINLHQGVVYQILGDGIMACFGSPVENTLHADMAFQASINILRQVETASLQKSIPATTIGIGLHSGMVVTGNIGNENRKQFSISGTPVIIASRIEQLNKKYQTEFLISGQVFLQIVPGKTNISPLGSVLLRGIEKPFEIYKVSLGKEEREIQKETENIHP